MPSDAQGTENAALDDSTARRGPRPPRTAIAALLCLLLLVNLAASLYQLPLNRVVERRLCLEYYGQHDPAQIEPDGSVREELCKVDSVQQGLGWLQGTMDTLWVVGDLAMTIPLGFVADRHGRRAVLWLNLVPRLLMPAWAVLVGCFDQALPTKAILAGPMLSFLGGGDCVFNSLAYSLAAGITDDYVLRASYFGYMSSVAYVVNLLGPALASASMTAMLWLPFGIGIALLAAAIPVVRLLPRHRHARGTDAQSQPLLSSPLLKAQDASHHSLLRAVVERFRTLRSVLASHSRNLSLLLVCFLLTSLASSDTKLLVQYISKRYHWTFAAAGYLLSGKAVVNFALLTLVVPRVLRSAAKAHAGGDPGRLSDSINIRFANACFGVSVVGALTIAVAATVWVLVPALLVYALGSALPIFTLSLLKSPSISSRSTADANNDDDDDDDDEQVETHIFSIVMLVKTLGSLLGAPLMAVLWVRGIGLGGAALGMPYFVSAACYVLATVVFGRLVVA